MSLSRSLARSVAASVDADPILLPVLADLFDGIDALGSSPRQIVHWLRRARIGPGCRLLDLACGKGSGSIAAAKALGCSVLAFDAFEPFLDAARQAAARAGVASRCRFYCADVSRLPRACDDRFHAAMMIGLFPFDKAAPILRRAVRPGGLYLIDDSLRIARADPRARFADVPTPREARAFIAALGDHVEHIVMLPPSRARTLNQRLCQRLAVRARRVARQHPRLRTALARFLHHQHAANRLLAGPLRPALVVIRRHS